MRVASRVLGFVLALAGVGFFVASFFVVTSGFDRKSVFVESGPDRTVWSAGALSAAFGVGFLLAGGYFLKLNVNELDETQEQPPSRFAPYFLAYRREFQVIAQTGFVISLIRLAVACFGRDWPGRWAALPLYVVSIGLLVIATQITRGGADHLDWERVPERMRPVLRIMWNAVGPALWILLGLLFVWNRRRHQVPPPIWFWVPLF